MKPIRFGLRGRLVIATSFLSLVTLGIAFKAVSFSVNRSQQRQLDDALVPAAREEAAHLSTNNLPGWPAPLISDRPGPAANDVGPLPKFVAVYNHEGKLASATQNFGDNAPALATMQEREGRCFDLVSAGQELRGVLVSVPRHAGTKLLMAVSKADLNGDASFLATAMAAVFAMAVAWTAAIAWWIAGQLTRAHRAIVQTTQRVMAGDLSARVGSRGSSADPEGLGRNIDEMVERLGLLLRGQQQFIAQAAHELRSPLTALYGELSFALRRERDAEHYRKSIEEALGATQRLKRLAEELLSLARLGTESSLTPGRIAMADVIGSAVKSVADYAHKIGITLDINVEAGLFVGRAGDVERMVRNLLENAVRHSPGGGTVIVDARRFQDDWLVEVRDQGTGVKPQDRGAIFEPFYRGSDARAEFPEGTGLGLAIARDIARLHGGDLVLCDAESGPGARFKVVLPNAFRAVNEDAPE